MKTSQASLMRAVQVALVDAIFLALGVGSVWFMVRAHDRWLLPVGVVMGFLFLYGLALLCGLLWVLLIDRGYERYQAKIEADRR